MLQMKKSFLFLFLFSLAFTAFSEEYNYNQNYNVGKYITEGTWTYFAPEAYNRVEMKMTKEETGLTDADGNKSYKLHFVSDEYDFYLVPDNPFFPLFYRLMEANGTDKSRGYRLLSSGTSGMDDMGYIVLNENHLACVSIYSDDTRPVKEDEVQHERIGVSVTNFEEIMQRLMPKTFCSGHSFIRAKGSGSPYKDWMEFMAAENLEHYYGAGQGTPITQYPGIPAYYEHLKVFLDKNMEEAKTKKLDALLMEFEDGDYTFYMKSANQSSFFGVNDGLVKLKFEKTNGKVTAVTVQNCFTDGVFYDKEKFFTTFTLDPSKDQGKISGKEFRFMPFDKKLFLLSIYNGEINGIWGVFSKDPADAFSEFMAGNRFWSVDKTDATYFCKTEFESEYGNIPDHYRMYEYFRKYYPTVRGQ
jgi:hypothetical protein